MRRPFCVDGLAFVARLKAAAPPPKGTNGSGALNAAAPAWGEKTRGRAFLLRSRARNASCGKPRGRSARPSRGSSCSGPAAAEHPTTAGPMQRPRLWGNRAALFFSALACAECKPWKAEGLPDAAGSDHDPQKIFRLNALKLVTGPSRYSRVRHQAPGHSARALQRRYG